MIRLTLKMKKGSIIAGLSALCVLLVLGIFAILGSGAGKTELTVALQDANDSISVGEIKNDKLNEPGVALKEVAPENKQDTDTSEPNDIQLTEIPVKPKPPEKPDTALTNPNKKPTETVKPVEPPKPNEDKPTSGETNSKDETYVPGFGWVKNSGSNEENTSQSDGDWNKQIGDMN